MYMGSLSKGLSSKMATNTAEAKRNQSLHVAVLCTSSTYLECDS
jgi:hypothetical protein